MRTPEERTYEIVEQDGQAMPVVGMVGLRNHIGELSRYRHSPSAAEQTAARTWRLLTASAATRHDGRAVTDENDQIVGIPATVLPELVSELDAAAELGCTEQRILYGYIAHLRQAGVVPVDAPPPTTYL